MKKPVLAALTAAFCVATLSQSPRLRAAGFALQEHSVPALGNAFAGGAAIAEDASTVYYNPAGMALIEKPELSAGLHFIFPDAAYSDEGTTTAGVPTQGEDATSRKNAILPNLFYVGNLNDDLAWGLGLSAPFGLETNYGDDWVGRYVARRTDLETVMLNPSLAYRIDKRWSVGVGVDYVRSKAVLSNAIDFGLLYLSQYQSGGIPVNETTAAIASDVQANLGGSKYDGSLELSGDGDGWGYNVGVLYEVNESLRIGAHYRSKIKVNIKGDADFTVGALEAFFGGLFADQGGRVDLELPDVLSFSAYYDFSDRWAFMADVTWTGWSSFQYLIVEYDGGLLPDSVIPEKWGDVYKYSVGASYRVSDPLMLRFGLAYDESPVTSDAYRSPRIPDADRLWVTTGVSYQFSESLALHASYLHIFVDDSQIDNDTHSSGLHMVGRIEAAVDLISFGLTKRF